MGSQKHPTIPRKIPQTISYPITVLHRQRGPIPTDLQRYEVSPPQETQPVKPPSHVDHNLQCLNGEVIAPSEFQTLQIKGKRGPFGHGVNFGKELELRVGETGAVYEM